MKEIILSGCSLDIVPPIRCPCRIELPERSMVALSFEENKKIVLCMKNCSYKTNCSYSFKVKIAFETDRSDKFIINGRS